MNPLWGQAAAQQIDYMGTVAQAGKEQIDFQAVALMIVGVAILLREIRNFMGQSSVKQNERLLEKLDVLIDAVTKYEYRHTSVLQELKPRIEQIFLNTQPPRNRGRQP